METAVALRKESRILKPLSRIAHIAITAFRARNGNPIAMQKDIIRAVQTDFEALKMLCGGELDTLIARKARQYSENIIKNKGKLEEGDIGQRARASDGQANSAKEDSSWVWSREDIFEELDGGHTSSTDGRSPLAAAKASPGHAKRGASAIASVQATMSNSLMDSFKIRDGRKIGDVMIRDLENLRSENAQEAAVLRQIQQHAANAPAHAIVREIITDTQLATMLDRARVIADA